MTRKQSILIVDDDSSTLDLIRGYLLENGYKVIAHTNPVLAIKAICDNDLDLVISDVKMNELTGDDILNYVLENKPGTGVFLMTGFGNINHCINAMKKGASDYITKPFDPDELLDRVKEFLKQTAPMIPAGRKADKTKGSVQQPASGNPVNESSGSEQNDDGISQPAQDVLPEPNKAPESYDSLDYEHGNQGQLNIGFSNSEGAESEKTEIRRFFVGDHPRVRRLLAMLDRLANNNAPVFIHGESGTGKEVFANLIHQSSQRRKKPYIKINCANLPSELVESTLFGHIKGSFTGAITDKKGAFEEAEGGTLLLDEVTEININVQAKLLRVLQEREYHRVGSQKPIRADVRIIATSNRNLTRAVSEGHFRQDLFYRLNVFPISLPPLRDRREDILPLAEYFVNRYCHQYGFPHKSLGDEMIKYLNSMEWKGNVRELENLIHRGVVMAHGDPELKVTHVLDAIFEDSDSEFAGEELTDLPLLPIEEMELQMIRKALEKTNGNQKEAALLLEISDRTIRNKLRKINIS